MRLARPLQPASTEMPGVGPLEMAAVQASVPSPAILSRGGRVPLRLATSGGVTLDIAGDGDLSVILVLKRFEGGPRAWALPTSVPVG
jgi:hypothetical protein